MRSVYSPYHVDLMFHVPQEHYVLATVSTDNWQSYIRAFGSKKKVVPGPALLQPITVAAVSTGSVR